MEDNIIFKFFDNDDRNDDYVNLKGNEIEVTQLTEPLVPVNYFILTNKDMGSDNNQIDKLAFRIPIVAVDDYRLEQTSITGFKLDYTQFVPTVTIDFVDTHNVMLSTGMAKEGSIIKVYIGGNGDEKYYKPIRQDFIATSIKKIDGGNQKYGDYFKYRVYGKLNIPYGYTCGGTSFSGNPSQVLFDAASSVGLGFATNFTKVLKGDNMIWFNDENSTIFDFMENVTSHACYSPYTFFTSFIDPYNILNFVECHSLLSHGGSKENIPAMIYSNYPDPYYDGKEKKILNTVEDEFNNNAQKVSYYFLSNADFYDGWSNYIEEYTPINNGKYSISNGCAKKYVYSDRGVVKEHLIYPINNLKRNSDGNIELQYGEVNRDSYIPMNINIADGGSISNIVTYETLGEVDTQNMFPLYYFAEAQNSFQMMCMKKCGLKIVLQNYNPAITKFSRIWVDIYDKNLISNTQLKKSEIYKNDSGLGREYKESKNKNIIKFDDEGLIENTGKNTDFPRGVYNRSLSGWYVITDMIIYYEPEERNLKMKLTLNRIEYKPSFVSDYNKGVETINKYSGIYNISDVINNE